MKTKQQVAGIRPGATAGMRHVALFVTDLDAASFFYINLLGMILEWQPDDDNIYLTSGNDNLALHRLADPPANTAGYEAKGFATGPQRLDHIGFIIDEMHDVDKWYEFLNANGVKMQSTPRTHRDGARSFYCLDPAGTVIQIIYHPPLSVGRSE